MTRERGEPSGSAWRGVVAALANDDLRIAFAQVTLGAAEIEDRQLERLLAVGLVELRDGVPVAAPRRMRALLGDRSAERPRHGPHRFLRADGAIDRYPARAADRDALLHLVGETAVKPGERVDEQTINDRLRPFDEDVARIRRLLVDHRVLGRTASGSEYFRP